MPGLRPEETARSPPCAGAQRPLAWIDDAHDAACRDWAAARPGATLLVATEPDVGLTAEHADALHEWVQSLSSTPASSSSVRSRAG